MKVTSLFLLLLFPFCFSCKKDSPQPTDIGLEYFPSEQGITMVYEIDSIVYNSFTLSVDTFEFDQKEVYANEMTDDGGRNVMLVQRWNRNPNDRWVEVKNWQFHKDNFAVETQEDNLRKVKLVFPISDGSSWDVNVRNTLEKFEVDLSGPKTESINGRNFSETITVDYVDEADPLMLDVERKYERYAKGVGLVEFYHKKLKRFTTGEEDDIPVDSGLVYIKTLKSLVRP